VSHDTKAGLTNRPRFEGREVKACPTPTCQMTRRLGMPIAFVSKEARLGQAERRRVIQHEGWATNRVRLGDARLGQAHRDTKVGQAHHLRFEGREGGASPMPTCRQHKGWASPDGRDANTDGNPQRWVAYPYIFLDYLYIQTQGGPTPPWDDKFHFFTISVRYLR
jgi:hypothetical protein